MKQAELIVPLVRQSLLGYDCSYPELRLYVRSFKNETTKYPIIPFIVDSGATVSILPADEAEQFGLATGETFQNLPADAPRTLSGPLTGSWGSIFILIPKLQEEPLRISCFFAAAVRKTHSFLLGRAGFLSHFNIKIEDGFLKVTRRRSN